MPLNLFARVRYSMQVLKKLFEFETDVKWGNVVLICGYHALSVYWCYHYAFPAKWQTLVFAFFMYAFCGLGVTIGTHRYWSHRAFKATRPLQYWLLLSFASCGQTSVLHFVRNHRLHHHCSDTPSDPHDATRGIFYSHIGWLMLKKHPETVRKGKQLDFSDITSDPLLMFHDRHVIIISVVCCFLAPTWLHAALCGEAWRCAVAWQCCIRFLMVFHASFFVNSLAHSFGTRPFNGTIKPADNTFVNVVTFGEGFHNYHHAFPHDYKGSRDLFTFNFATLFIKLYEKLGLAYDLREASPEAVKRMADKLGVKEDGHLQ